MPQLLYNNTSTAPQRPVVVKPHNTYLIISQHADNQQRRFFSSRFVVRTVLILFIVHHSSFIISKAQAQPQSFKDSIITICRNELATYLTDFKQPLPLPTQFRGTPIGGDFAWSEFAASLATYRQITGKDTLAGQNLTFWIKSLLLESAPKAHTFGQLFIARALYTYGPIASNPLWKSLSAKEQSIVRQGLDVSRSYDFKLGKPATGRPSNYVAVGLLIEANSVALGVSPNRNRLDTLFAKCFEILDHDGGWLDDDRNGQGRFDRYHFEFIRFIREAALMTDSKKWYGPLRSYEPQSRSLFLALINPAQWHSAPYGRSLQNAWDDVFEYIPMLITYPLSENYTKEMLEATFFNAARYYLKNQFNTQTHMNRMLDSGRGTYSYAGPERVWQYTVGSFTKLMRGVNEMHQTVAKTVSKTHPTDVKTPAQLPDIQQLFLFRDKERHKAGIFVHRTPACYYAIPFVAGMKGINNADYSTAPYGFQGLQQVVSGPAIVTPVFHTLEGKTLAPCGLANDLTYNDSALQITYDRLTASDNSTTPAVQTVLKIKPLPGCRINYDYTLRVFSLIATDTIQLTIPTSIKVAGIKGPTPLLDDVKSDFEVRPIFTNIQGPPGRGPFQPVKGLIQLRATHTVLEEGRAYHLNFTLKPAPPQ